MEDDKRLASPSNVRIENIKEISQIKNVFENNELGGKFKNKKIH